MWTNRSGSVLESFAYAYDKAGNRLSMTEANGSWANYRYDNLYRLLNESYSNGRSIGYTYDADGNRLTSREVRVGGSLVVTTDTYGKEDQLLKAAIAGGATTTYTYDKNGNVKTTVIGSATTTNVYDIKNRLTSVTTSSSCRYDAFGAFRAQSGSSNSYGFASREDDAGLSLYYNRARYYDPPIGRFLSKDSVGTACRTKQYAYAADNPASRTDPSGLLPIWDLYVPCTKAGGSWWNPWTWGSWHFNWNTFF